MAPAPQTDFEQIFEALGRVGARYVVVGGVAVLLQGHPRFTADLDLVVGLEPSNVQQAIGALASLDYRPRAPVALDQFADAQARRDWIEQKGLTVFSLWSPRFPATDVDLFVAEPMPFDEMWRHADQVELGGTTVAVASIEDLVAMKQKAGRPKDLQDIAELRKLLVSRTEEP